VEKLFISSCEWNKYVSSTNHEYHLIAHILQCSPANISEV